MSQTKALAISPFTGIVRGCTRVDPINHDAVAIHVLDVPNVGETVLSVCAHGDVLDAIAGITRDSAVAMMRATWGDDIPVFLLASILTSIINATLPH